MKRTLLAAALVLAAAAAVAQPLAGPHRTAAPAPQPQRLAAPAPTPVLAPQSNPYLCGSSQFVDNQDICDRQRSSEAHSGM